MGKKAKLSSSIHLRFKFVLTITFFNPTFRRAGHCFLDVLGNQLLNIYGATFNLASWTTMKSNITKLSFTELLDVSNNEQLVCKENITRTIQWAKNPQFGGRKVFFF